MENKEFDTLEHHTMETLIKNGFKLTNKKEIQYGTQLSFANTDSAFNVRLFASKKGCKTDLSPIKDASLKKEIASMLGQSISQIEKKKTNARITDTERHANAIIGVDESGKGDYFGPLVTVAAYIHNDQIPLLEELGVKDSKALTDKDIARIAKDLRASILFTEIAIGNERYNALYKKIGNLNSLLAWAHARAIENILEQQPCAVALSDQFGKAESVKRALLEKGKSVTLLQRPKAESNPAVAAASIIARDSFVRRMYYLSKELGLTLPKGASNKVKSIAKEAVALYGPQVLNKIAKTHFSTTKDVLG